MADLKKSVVFGLFFVVALSLFGAEKPLPKEEAKAEAEAATTMVAASVQSASVSTTQGVTASPQSAYQPNQDVNYAGAFTYSYPIQIPAGTNGLQPSLALTYNSSGPNDLLGKGFSLQGLSAITRDSSYPVTFTNTDRYALDGQKLFSLAADKTFHPERENFDQIQAFLTTAENTPVSDPNNAAAFWVVKKKDGTQHYYGDYPGRATTATNKSTIPALGKTTPRLWALSKVKDAVGNFYTYNYHYDAVTGAYYPISIVYTQAAGLTLFKTVQFSYETRPDHGPMYTPTKVDLDHRLAWITVLVGTDVNGNGGTLLRKYHVSYSLSATTGQTILTSLQEHGSNGDVPVAGYLSATYVCGDLTANLLPIQTLAWQSETNGFIDTGDWTSTPQGTVAIAGVADVDGDGRADLILQYDQTSVRHWVVRLSNGSGFVDKGDWTTANLTQTAMVVAGVADVDGDGKADLVLQYDLNGTRHWVARLSNGSSFVDGGVDWDSQTGAELSVLGVADADGDGKADLIVWYDGMGVRRWQARLSTGSAFVNAGDWGSQPGTDLSTVGIADANGDGKVDLIVQYDSGGTRHWQARISTGSSFVNGGDWDTQSGPVLSTIGVADANGDGKADLLVQYDSAGTRYWQARISTGSSFINGGDWSTVGGTPSSMIADANGDGKVDLIVQYDGLGVQRWQARLSNGVSFVDSGDWSSQPGTGLSLVGVSDLNADGLADLLLQYDSGGTRHLQGRLVPGSIPDLVTQVTLPAGGMISVEYTPAPQITGAVQPANSNYATGIANAYPRPLATKVTVYDGVNHANDIVTTYSYSNSLRKPGNADQRVDLGFQTVTKTVAGAQTVTTFDQTVPLHGLTTSVVVQDTAPVPNKYAQSDYTYVATNPYAALPSSYFQKLTQTMSLKYDGLGNNTPTRTKKTMAYDTAGNLTQSLDWGLVNAAGQSIDRTGALTTQAQVQEDYTYNANTTFPTYLYRLKQKTTSAWDENHTAFTTSSQTKYFYDSQSFGTLGTAGLMTKREDWVDATKTVTTTQTYDAWGNVLTLRDGRVNDSTDPLFGSGDTEVRTYDTAYQAHLKTLKNALWSAAAPTKNLTTIGYDTLMRPITTTDINGQITITHYDSFSRADHTLAPTVSPSPADTPTNPTARTTYFDNTFPTSALSEQKTSTLAEAPAYLATHTHFDGLGRTLQTKRQAVGGWITQDYTYDNSGRNNTITVPYLTATSANTPRDTSHGLTTFTYDVLGRVTQVTHPDTTVSQTQYQKTLTRTIDENLHVTEVEDYGNLTITTRLNGNHPAAVYDPAVNPKITTRKYRGLTTVTDNKGNTIRSTTDGLGRQTQYQDPDIGIWSYTYDANSNLKTRTDNQTPAQVLTYTYDKLNRLLTKTAVDTTVNATYTYDETGHGAAPVGRLTSVTFNRGSDSYSYDERGRNTSKTRTLDTHTQTESFTYDSLNRVRTQTLPDGEVLTSTYGADGNLVTLTGAADYLMGIGYSALGKVRTMSYGNGITTTYNYYDDATADPKTGKTLSYRLRQILAGTSNSVMNLTYSYWANDNIYQRTDANNPTYSETYTYDDMDRLTSSVSAAGGTQSFTYDSINNILTKDGLTYAYGSSRPHAVTSTGTYSYSYDPNGNMTGRTGGRTLTYDDENRVTSMVDGAVTSSYVYDAQRQRTIKTEGTKTTYYFFDDYEEDYDSNSANVPYPVNNTSAPTYFKTAFTSIDPWSRFTDVMVSGGVSVLGDDLVATIPTGTGLRLLKPAASTTVVQAKIKSDVTTTIWLDKDGASLIIPLTAGVWTTVQATLSGPSPYVDFNYPTVSCTLTIDSIYVGDGTAVPGLTDYRVALTANKERIAQVGPQGISYIHSDHLGSSTKMTNTAGAVVRAQGYKPYGADAYLSGTATTKYQYTGQEKETGGLYYYNARYYDPDLGRFTSPDPVVWDGQYWGNVSLTLEEQTNPYLYAMNNPVRYTDPTGLDAWSIASRNMGNGVSLGLSYLEVRAGFALTAGMMTKPLGVTMVAHGGANFAATSAKIALTTIDEMRNGVASADALNNSLPDSAIGMFAYGLGSIAESVNGEAGTKEKAGALGDIIDVGVGISLGWLGATKAVDMSNDMANKATSLSIHNTNEGKIASDYANSNLISQIGEGIASTWSNLMTLFGAEKKLEE